MENREANEETQESRMDLTGRTLQKIIVGEKKKKKRIQPLVARKKGGRNKSSS